MVSNTDCQLGYSISRMAQGRPICSRRRDIPPFGAGGRKARCCRRHLGPSLEVVTREDVALVVPTKNQDETRSSSAKKGPGRSKGLDRMSGDSLRKSGSCRKACAAPAVSRNCAATNALPDPVLFLSSRIKGRAHHSQRLLQASQGKASATLSRRGMREHPIAVFLYAFGITRELASLE